MKKLILKVFVLAIMALMTSCGMDESFQKGNDLNEKIRELNLQSKKIESLLMRASEQSDEDALNEAKSMLSQLDFPIIKGLQKNDSLESIKKKKEFDILKEKLNNQLNNLLQNSPIEIYTKDELIINQKTEPVYFSLTRGDSLLFECKFDNKISNISILSESTQNKIFSKQNIDVLNDKVFIPHTDVYAITINNIKDIYGDIKIYRIAKNFKNRNFDIEPTTDSIETIKSDKNAKPFIKLEFTNIFNEPRKATLNSKGKNMLGFGESRVIIPIKLPQNSKEWIYRIRISFGEDKTDEDGKFVSEVRSEYNKYKLFGMTVWESEGKRSSLVRELLNNIFPPTKEEAYCNLFIMTDEKNTKKFLSGGAFDYNLNSSQKNIQSINGQVNEPVKGQIYLGLENTNLTKPVYIYLEVVALLEKINYFKVVRKVQIKES